MAPRSSPLRPVTPVVALEPPPPLVARRLGSSADLQALLQACKDAPDEETPRLILADWLEDHGLGDRAECVRLSCRQLRLHPYDRRWALYRAVTNDPTSEAGRWLAPVRAFFPGTDWYGGLIRVHATPEQLRQHSPDELPEDCLPWLETLRLRVDSPGPHVDLFNGWLRLFTALDLRQQYYGALRIQQLLLMRETGAPALDSLRRLDLSYSGLQGIAPLAGQAHRRLPHLRVLELAGNRALGDAGAEQLACSPLLSRLTALDLSGTNITADAVRRLACCAPEPLPLRKLDLGVNHLGQPGMASLFAGPGLRNVRCLSLQAGYFSAQAYGELQKHWPDDWPLESLDLSSNDLNDECVRHIAGSRVLGPSLRRLDLTGKQIHDSGRTAGLHALLDGLARNGPGLERLGLRRCQIGDEGASLLAGYPALAGLRELDLDSNGIGPVGAAALAGSPHLRHLEALCLANNPLGPAGYRALATGQLLQPRQRRKSTTNTTGAAVPPALPPPPSALLPSLRSLDLGKTRPTRVGLEVLAGSALLARLEFLRLSNNRLYAAGAEVLARSPGMAGLRGLELAGCSLSDAGMENLASSEHLGRLVALDLSSNRIGDRSVQALVERPFQRLRRLELRSNRISDVGAEAVLGWKPADSWAVLALSGNPMSRQEQERLSRAAVAEW